VGATHYKDRSFACQQKLLRKRAISQNAILWAMKIISTTEAAKRLNVSPSRIRAMISSGRLKGIKVGKVWLIDPKDLDAVKDRKVGRPRKARKASTR
jgi:excisionase family DNA binding protein